MSLSDLLAVYTLLNTMLKRSMTFFSQISAIPIGTKILLLEYAVTLITTRQSIESLLKKKKTFFNKSDLGMLKKALSSCADYEIKLHNSGISLDLH